ncbi:MAG: hypothetical protein ACRDRA_22055 [Pseudonocardiaceae bacterium]
MLATHGDLGRPREVISLAEELFRTDTGLPSVRLVDVHISTARAHLDLGDRDNAQTSLVRAWDIAPQQAKIHHAHELAMGLRAPVPAHRTSHYSR